MAATGLFLMVSGRSPVLAQDIHFSQYLSSPFNLNPALAGDFNGDYRLTGNYRNQWKSITLPYKTYGIAGDMTRVAGLPNLSAGLSLYNDIAGDSRMNTIIVQIPLSIGYAVTSDSAHSVYFGIMPSYSRQQFDYSDLTFDNQYNYQTGRPDPGMASGETWDRTAVSYINVAAGLRWSWAIRPRSRLDAGIGSYNLAGSEKYYCSDSKSDQRRYNVHVNYQQSIHEKVDIIPGALYSRQGQNSNLLLGSSLRYIYNGQTAFHSGLWYRESDAFILCLGLTYQTLYAGFSYDINTSRLSEASRSRGAYEVSVIYVMRKFKPSKGKYLSCPNYL